MLLERQAQGRPVTVGLIGAGKFGTMFLSQVRTTAGMHVVAVADLNVGARPQRSSSASAGRRSSTARPRSTTRCKRGTTFVTDDAEALIAASARSR